MTDPLYCKDCKYCRPDVTERVSTLGFRDGLTNARCARPKENDLVSGKSYQDLCSNERISRYTIDTCAKGAEYFEARK